MELGRVVPAGAQVGDALRMWGVEFGQFLGQQFDRGEGELEGHLDDGGRLVVVDRLLQLLSHNFITSSSISHPQNQLILLLDCLGQVLQDLDALPSD